MFGYSNAAPMHDKAKTDSRAHVGLAILEMLVDLEVFVPS